MASITGWEPSQHRCNIIVQRIAPRVANDWLCSPRYTSMNMTNKRRVAGNPCLTRALKRRGAASLVLCCLRGFLRGEQLTGMPSDLTDTCVVWLRSPLRSLVSPMPPHNVIIQPYNIKTASI